MKIKAVIKTQREKIGLHGAMFPSAQSLISPPPSHLLLVIKKKKKNKIADHCQY